MAALRLRKTTEPRQALFGHGSLINPSAEHTILDPFQSPLPTITQISHDLAQKAVAVEAALAVNPLDPIVIRPDSYNSEPGQPLPSID